MSLPVGKITYLRAEPLPAPPDRSEEIATKLLAERIAELENEVLADLAHCETGGIEEPEAQITYDTNGKMSIGVFQWQRESIIDYHVRVKGMEAMTKKEATMLAMDVDESTSLTREVMFTVENGWTHWRNCSNKNNIAQRVTLINQLAGR